MDRTSTSPTSGPREDQPQAWVNLSLPAVARHVLVIRRRRMRRAVAAVEGRLRGRRDRFAREWRALRHKLEQHLAKERTWMRGDPVPSGRVASANQEHEFLQDRLTSWQAGLEAEGDALRGAVGDLVREFEEQVYCEQVLLFPRLRACREPFRAPQSSRRISISGKGMV